MGALRAAECHAFGMEAVGAIAHEYLTPLRDAGVDVVQRRHVGQGPLVEIERLGPVSLLGAGVASELNNQHDNQDNGKCDRQGRLWAGTMCNEDWHNPTGALYKFDVGRRITRMSASMRPLALE